MSARGRDHQVVDTDVPVDVIDDIEELQPGDAAFIYLAGPGYTPGVYAPVDVIDVIDVLDDVQPGDTALIYLAGPGPCLVAGTVESVMAPGRKRPGHQITFTAPVTDDPDSSQLQVLPESNQVFVRAYRVNQSRVERRARRALSLAADAGPSAAYPSAPLVAPEPQIVSGVIGSVDPWGLLSSGHLITYTAPALDDGSYQFPVTRPSAYAFISAHRAHTT